MYQLNPLLETTVARRLLDSGKLSTKDIMRLRRAHMVPTKKQFIDGVNRGTDNMLRKMGAKVTPVEDPLRSQFIPRGKQVSIPNATSKSIVHSDNHFSPTQIAIIRRHEAREAARNRLTDKVFQKQINRSNQEFYKEDIPKYFKAVCPHGHNVGVLSDEGKLVKQLRNRYGITTTEPGSNNLIIATSPKGTLIRGTDGYSYDLSLKDEIKLRNIIFKQIEKDPSLYDKPDKLNQLYFIWGHMIKSGLV